LIKKCDFVVLPEKLTGYRVRTDGQNLSLDKRNRARVLFELHCAYKRFFDGVDPDFFIAAFADHLRKKNPSGNVGIEFEKAFLYLKMTEPSIRALGLELLYALLALPEGRKIGASDYDLKIDQLWDLSKMPIYTDSQSMDQAVLEAAELAQRLKSTETELASLRETLRQITSGKLWRLRQKVHTILKGPF
jgi:hypothetical protein